MRAPDFWWQTPPNLIATALMPAGYVWGAISARRMQQSGVAADAPVICIGNFVAGGAGKTPTALACAAVLARNGMTIAFLTRGYGGTLSKSGRPVRVEPGRHSAIEVGDEPLLLARVAPAFVSSNRVAGANAATALGADVLVMDDGLQNPSLQKTLSIAVVDGETGAGNELCIPAGPLRAPLAVQLPMIDALVVIGEGEAGERLAGRALSHGKAVFRGHLQPDAEIAASFHGRKVVAFAGIGRPEKFFATLAETGADVVEAFGFDDHQMFSADNIDTLKKAAQHHEAVLVTTEKDFMRLGDAFGDFPLAVLPVTLALEKDAAFAQFLLQGIEGNRTPRP